MSNYTRVMICLIVSADGVWAQQSSTAHDFTIVGNRGEPAHIVIAPDPSVSARFAAAELQEHVKQITGAQLPIVTDEAAAPGPRILVGPSNAARNLGITGQDLASQEYLIRFLPDTLVLLGRDEAREQQDQPAPPRAAGKFGRALQFKGGTNVLRVRDCGFDDEVGTMEAWVWLPASSSAQTGTILRLDGADPWSYHIIQRQPNSSRIVYVSYDGKNGHQVTSGELAEGWHHVAATHHAHENRMELFVDGKTCGTAEYVKTSCRDAVLQVGGTAMSDAAAVSNPLEGLIDEVRISRSLRDVKTDATGGPYALDSSTTSLLHFDEDGGPVRDAAQPPPPPELFASNGTLAAVYHFLDRFCGVRWYAPGEIGRVCPRNPTLTIHGQDVRRSPAMIHRSITPTPLFMPAPPQKVASREVDIWKLRMRMGGQAFWVCHSFYGYYDRFLKSHPDWFAQGYPGQPPQMCYTNPDFIAHVVAEARDYFDGKGASPGATAVGDVFGLVPMDNMSWCKCPRCQAEMNQEEQSNLQFNNGKASNYVFNFVNRVAREVRKTHPNKWIGALAYSDYAYYPTRFKLEPNVVVQLCLHTRNWWCPSMEVNDRRVLSEWRSADPQRPLYLWLYYCFPALNAQTGNFHYFPGFFAHTAMDQMKMFHDAHVQGIFMEHSSECGQTFLMDQLEFYVTLKLADDPSLDGRQLIDEFFVKYYGPAGPPMKAIYERIERTFSSPQSYPPDIQHSKAHQHQNEQLAWGSLGTETLLTELDGLLARARQAASTPVEKQRVEMFATAILDYMREGRRLFMDKNKPATSIVP